MKYVIDASVGFQWAVTEPNSARARQLRRDFQSGVHDLLAPDFFVVEMANALLVAERRGRLLPGEGSALLADLLLDAPVLHPAISFLTRGYDIAHRSKASVYDSLYVALAEREGCELVTADAKLAKNLRAAFPFITLLASLP